MKRSLLTAILAVLLLCSVCLLCACNKGTASGDNYDYENPATPPEKSDSEDFFSETGKSETPAERAEKIIKDVSLTLQTKKYDDALSALRDSVAALGGFEESLRASGRSYGSDGYYTRHAAMTVRIPAEKLDEFLNQVGKNAILNVVDRSETATNVTTQYYDIESRIAVLESERAAYEAMLEKSEDVAYVLEIKGRLYDVIEEIEAYRTKLRYYDSKVAYSTVNITLNEVVEYTQVSDQMPSFGERLSRAFVTGWKNFATAFQAISVGLVYALPLWLVIGLITAGAILLSRRSLRRRIARQAKLKASDEGKTQNSDQK